MTRSQILVLFILLLFGAIGFYFIFLSNDDLDDYAGELNEIVDTKSIDSNLKLLAARPHRAGSPENRAAGDRIIQELRDRGASVWTTEYTVELPDRGNGSISMIFPEEKQINYSEKVLGGDPYTSVAQEEQPFFAYIPDTDIEAEVIYANFGDRQDYKYLKDRGISPAGKIALVRTQGSCRGMKQMIAEEEGLAGLLLYPEQKDQGFKKPPYPTGPSINPWVAQRGSMLKFFLYPGDPDSRFQDQRENTLPTVPSIPITPDAAVKILEQLGGEENDAWKGWMNVPYKTGPGPVRLRIQFKSSKSAKKIRNIFATLGGTNSSDPVLMISTHYDAWIYGASDPGSGTAAILEAAKALFALEKKGWKPKRDIVFAFWDAEEYGMIGSTQWVLQNLKLARGKVGNLLYVDSVRGPMFKGNLPPGLRGHLDQVLARFQDPNTGKSVLEFHVQYGMPGFSDDTIPFSNLAGIPVAQLNYGLHYTMYHSIYDNLHWMQNYGDPEYRYVANLARIVSLFAIVLTREDTLPFRFSEFATHYEQELSKIALENIVEQEPKQEIQETIRVIREVGVRGKQFEDVDLSGISADRKKQINELLLQAVMSFTEVPGRTGVPFRLRNVLYGPSTENECAGTDLPGVRRALDQKDGAQLNSELRRFRIALVQSNEFLKRAASLLETRD